MLNTRKKGHRTLVALVGLGCTVLPSLAAAQSGLATWDEGDDRTVPAATQNSEAPDAAAPEAAAPSPSEPTAEPSVSASADGAAAASAEVSLDGASAKEGTAASAEATTAKPGAGEWNEMRSLRELEAKNGFVPPPPEHELEWHGGLELDIAHANYTFADDIAPEETLYDFRGRFVVGPTVTHDFGDSYFLAARAELVGWVRERENVYLINVDDVYARGGKAGVWDITAGRFNAWRVYHRGRGFDLYTVEDLGACTQGNCATQNPQNFGVSMYEVDNIYMRGPYGRIAGHIYPTDWTGIELLAEYGSSDTMNILGGRAAGMLRTDYFRVSAAAEYRKLEPTTVIEPVDANGVPQPCPKCNTSGSHGFGGSVEVTPVTWLEVGFSAAKGEYEGFSPVNGSPNLDGTGSVTTYGGYGEIDVGSLLGRSFIVGGGAHWTQQNVDNGNYDSHTQMAAFLAYPLGFNASELKLVASHATLDRINGGTNVETSSASNAVRLRFTYPY